MNKTELKELIKETIQEAPLKRFYPRGEDRHSMALPKRLAYEAVMAVVNEKTVESELAELPGHMQWWLAKEILDTVENILKTYLE